MARPASTAFDKEIRSQVAANLNTLLRRKGWTKADLAKQSQISPSTLSGYFNEKYNITPGNLQILSDIFGVEKGDIDPRYKTSYTLNPFSIEEFLSARKHSAANNALALLFNTNDSVKWHASTEARTWMEELTDTEPAPDHNPSINNTPNSLANRKANISKPDSDLNPEEQLDKFTLQAEANTASILLEKYIETANQLLSIRNKINPSEDLQRFLTIIAGTVTVAEDIKREYLEILLGSEQKQK